MCGIESRVGSVKWRERKQVSEGECFFVNFILAAFHTFDHMSFS